MSETLSTPLRFITATSLFDGHDAAIHIFRRLLIAKGVEVIHLGHDRSVQEVVQAAIQEDVQGIAVSSYQGGHLEYFTYMQEELQKKGLPHIRIFGGGGGVILPSEIKQLHALGSVRIYTPEDGSKMGLQGIVDDMVDVCQKARVSEEEAPGKLIPGDHRSISRWISYLDRHSDPRAVLSTVAGNSDKKGSDEKAAYVVGLSGTGGSGKSTLLDGLVHLFSQKHELNIAVLCVDPSRRKTGGAMLGDRLRFNSNYQKENIFIYSLATHGLHESLNATLKQQIKLLKSAGFDLIFVESSGTGQSDTSIVDLCDLALYVMTPEFGAPSQLEKINMLDYAGIVVVNKIEKRGGLDVVRDVKKVVARSRELEGTPPDSVPVIGASAHVFGDAGVHSVFKALIKHIKNQPGRRQGLDVLDGLSEKGNIYVTNIKEGYLGRIVSTLREEAESIEKMSTWADRAQSIWNSLQELGLDLPDPGGNISLVNSPAETNSDREALINIYNELVSHLNKDAVACIQNYPRLKANYAKETQEYQVRNQKISMQNYSSSLSGTPIPKVCLPENLSWGGCIQFFNRENLPGYYPFTAGVFPFKRKEEEVTRMFAGEGNAERTNKRFHYLSKDRKATRLSTAFDSVTLYGRNPDDQPDVYGKVGNSGVSICTLDDMKRLYSGFDLMQKATSVSMTINGPAPMLMAYFLNTAIDAECEREMKKRGEWEPLEKKIQAYFASKDCSAPIYRQKDLPKHHDGSGLGFLGVPSREFMQADVYHNIKERVFQTIRGTIQADILKEDQAQNTCIFSRDFAISMMGDMQEYFVQNQIRNFYSVSISGYHIAEAGANPITQLAFTLANGFTYLEYYLSRGMPVDDFAPNLSFFFSNGMDPEYSVLGRVARRIWATALKKVYGASELNQKLKYHIQTSGRALHSKEVEFNDIRTTLQALMAINDNCNSLHTNAFDEAITTPTEASVRRAVAIQLIIEQEFGVSQNENPLQGSYLVDYLTRELENSVLDILTELDSRGGVLGAMEVNYHRARIQDESLNYEQKKQKGELPLIGVNTFLNATPNDKPEVSAVIRSTDTEKRQQVEQITWWNKLYGEEQLKRLQKFKTGIQQRQNTFQMLMELTPYCTLGDISKALFEAGGKYRRNT